MEKRAAVLLLGGFVLVGCGSGVGHGSTTAQSAATTTPTTVPSPDIKVIVALGVAQSTDDEGAHCTATYHGSGQVTLTNQSGTVLGQQEIPLDGGAGTWDNAQYKCEFTLDMGTIPVAGVTQFGVAVGQATPIYFSASEAASDNYTLAIVSD